MKKSKIIIIGLRGLLFLTLLTVVWYLRGTAEWLALLIGLVLIGLNYQALLSSCRDRYLTRKTFGDKFRFWAILSLILFVYVIVTLILGLPRLNLFRILLALGIIALGIYLPLILAEAVALISRFFTGSRHWHLLKEIYPYHRHFIKVWESASLKVKIGLALMEPEAIKFPPAIRQLLEVWIILGELSLLTLIKKDNRPEYRFLIGDDESKERILDIENSDLKKEEMVLTIRTEGDLIAENLLTGKARAKIYEHFAAAGRPVKSLSYNSTPRQVLIQFFLQSENMPPEILEIAQKLEMGFTDLEVKNSLNVYPHFEGFEVIDQENKPFSGGTFTAGGQIYSVKLVYKLPSGLPAELISKNKIEALASYIRLPLYQHKLRPYDEMLELYVELASRQMSKLSYIDFPSAEGLRIALGFDLKYRRPVYINFDQAEVQEGDPGFTPHLLIAGATASGKSSFIKFMIMQLLRSHSPDSLRFFMVDPKVVTFRIFNKLPHLYAPIVSDADKFQVTLSGIVEEVERRYRVLAQADVENIYQLHSKFPEKAKEMPRILVIVDEFADIIDSHSWKVREQIIMTLKRLGQKARAAGVHLILITQRATSANIDSEVKANISGRICFKVASEGDSQVVIESPIGADLLNPGEGYARLGDSDELVHFQAPYVSDEELRDAMQKYEGLPQVFLDNTLTEEILKKPLRIEDIKLNMLPETRFPIVPVGINLESHKPVFLMLSRPEVKSNLEPTPHVIVAGATNSGKSQFAKLLVRQLALSGGPDLVKLILIDPKAVSFVAYKKLPHLACPLVTKHFQLLPLIREMLKVIEERYELFAEKEVENIEEYRLHTGESLPSYVMVIDEFADLLDYYDYRERDEVEKMLKRFGQMARAAGVHLILITQRATSQNISGEIRANFSGRMAFRMNSEADSFYILEESGAEKLVSAGLFMLRKAHYPLEYGYAPMLTDEELKEIVAKMEKKYGQIRPEQRLEEALCDASKKNDEANNW